MSQVSVGSPPTKPRILQRSTSRSSSKENCADFETPKTSTLFFKTQNSAMVLKQNTQFINTFLSPQKDLFQMKTFQTITSYPSNSKEVKPVRLFQDCETQKMGRSEFQPIRECNVVAELSAPTQNSLNESFSKPFELLPMENKSENQNQALGGKFIAPNQNFEQNFKKKPSFSEAPMNQRSYCASAKKYDEIESEEKSKRKYEDLLQSIKKETAKQQNSIAQITFLKTDFNNGANYRREDKRNVYMSQVSSEVKKPPENYQRENHFKKTQGPFIRPVHCSENKPETNYHIQVQNFWPEQKVVKTTHETISYNDQNIIKPNNLSNNLYHSNVQNPSMLRQVPIINQNNPRQKENNQIQTQQNPNEKVNAPLQNVKVEDSVNRETFKVNNYQASENIFNKILTGKITIVQDRAQEKNSKFSFGPEKDINGPEKVTNANTFDSQENSLKNYNQNNQKQLNNMKTSLATQSTKKHEIFDSKILQSYNMKEIFGTETNTNNPKKNEVFDSRILQAYSNYSSVNTHNFMSTSIASELSNQKKVGTFDSRVLPESTKNQVAPTQIYQSNNNQNANVMRDSASLRSSVANTIKNPIFENKCAVIMKDNTLPLRISQYAFQAQTLKNSIQVTVPPERAASVKSVSNQQKDIQLPQTINNVQIKNTATPLRSSSTNPPAQRNIDSLVEDCLSKTRNVLTTLENNSRLSRDPQKICTIPKKPELPPQISKELNSLNTPIFKTKIDQMFYNALNRSESLITKHYTVKNGSINPKGQSKPNEEDSQVKYNGDLQNNMKHGFGLLTNNMNQKIYIGDWKLDKYHGQGVLYNVNLDASGTTEVNYKNVDLEKLPWKMYEGEFQNGEFNGMGSLSFISGERLNGYFVKGKLNGEATFYQSDGEIVKGIWEQSVLKNVLY